MRCAEERRNGNAQKGIVQQGEAQKRQSNEKHRKGKARIDNEMA